MKKKLLVTGLLVLSLGSSLAFAAEIHPHQQQTMPMMGQMMNPEQMILSSDLGEASKLMNPILQEAIHKYSYRVHPIEISYSGKGYNQILRGMVDIICTARASSIWLQG